MVPEEFWDAFVEEYSSSEVYWFFPKGSTVDTDQFREKFRVFDLFEGMVWRPDLHGEILRELRSEGLSSAGAALPRMIKRVFEVMGLCIVESDQPIRITKIGKRFLDEDSGPSKVLDRSIWRYQLPTPVNDSDVTHGIALHPHPFLIEVLLRSMLEISAEEYALFVARSMKPEDVEKSVERIAAWRDLKENKRRAIRTRLSGTVLQTIERNRSYAFAFHNCDLAIDKVGQTLSVRHANVAALERRLELFKQRAPLYRFETDKDYVEFIASEPETKTPLEELEHYVDVSDVENAVRAFKKLPDEFRAGQSVEDFEKEQFLEKDLEYFLSKNMELIEPGLVFKSRQYQTSTGPLDLLGVAANGDLVVIELKKGRASDKVFGQIARYMGSMMNAAETGQFVRGFIVAREIDQKLVLASRISAENRLKALVFELEDSDGKERWVRIGSESVL